MSFTSSTQSVPVAGSVPRHIAVILDGNGRWATRRHLPRAAGHRKGVEAVRTTVEGCARRGVEFLTLFAFSSENWRRPADEVSLLMRLFLSALQREVALLDRNGIRLRIVGDLERFEPRLQKMIADAEARTAQNTRMTLTIAANYGGRWDILQAGNALLRERAAKGVPADQPITEAELASHLSLAYAPEPDLFIRTGGEQRISNFLLWQCAYSELFFSDRLWPDFDEAALDEALAAYAVKTLTPQAHLALMGSRFTVNQERESKLCQSLLLDAGFMPMPYWVDASVTDTFALLAEEVESSGQGVLVAFMGNMAAKEMWRTFMRTLTPWRLWHCGRPDESFLSFQGMVFADQNLFLEKHGGFQDLKRRLWNTRTLQVPDSVAAGRADALAQWLIQGLSALPGPLESLDRPALLDRLGRAERIPFGNQVLDVNPELHRPRRRQVYILEIREREYSLLDTLSTQGPAYFSY